MGKKCGFKNGEEFGDRQQDTIHRIMYLLNSRSKDQYGIQRKSLSEIFQFSDMLM